MKPLLTICSANAISVEHVKHLRIFGCARESLSSVPGTVGFVVLVCRALWSKPGLCGAKASLGGELLGEVDTDERGENDSEGGVSVA